MRKWIDRLSNTPVEYGKLFVHRVGDPVHAMTFSLVEKPTHGEVLASAKRVGRNWLLRIPGHRWDVTPEMPTNRLNSIPGDGPIATTDVKTFPSWQACAKEVERIKAP